MSRNVLWIALLTCAAAFGVASLAAAAPLGSVTEFNAGLNPGAVPFRITSGADGNLWFTDQGTTKAIGNPKPAFFIESPPASLV